MRIARIVDAVPANHSNETNNDSEPNIAVNFANPAEMAITSFTPPDPGLTDGPIYYTSDFGENWSLVFDVAGNGSQDQTIGFSPTASELYMATLRADTSTLTLNVDRTAVPATAQFPIIETRSPLDQPWVRVMTVPSGANAGKVCTYVGYGDMSAGYWATVDVCLDALAASPSFTKIKLDPRTAIRDGYHTRPVPHPDGTVYAGYQSWQSQSGNNTTMYIVVARDDNWGNDSFGDLTDPSDSLAGRIVATVTVDESTALGGQRPDNGFDLQVDPNDSDVVYISWIDNGGTGFQTHVRRSLDRGKSWSGDLITVDSTAIATLAINSQSTVALAYLQLVNNQWDTHFRTTSDGTTWDDLLLATTATNGFMGDYMRMVPVAANFYGCFPAFNTPTATNFFPNGGGTLSFQRNNNGTQLLGTDNTTVISSSTDPFFFKIEEKDATFVLNRNPIGQDEVDARRKQPPGSSGGLPIQDAFRVIVDGFTASQLGLTGLSSTLTVTSSLSDTVMPITCTGNTSDNGDYGTEIQRFTFYYSLNFDAADDAFDFSTQTSTVTLNVTAGPVSSTALLTLIKQPDPFMLHGTPSWLSVDLRFVVAQQSQSIYGVSGISGPADAPRFIQQLMAAITPAQFDALPSGESATELYLQPTDDSNVPVFNFALAKVHYIGLIGASTVRVFFRLFNAQSTTSTYDYPPGAQYRRATSNPDGQPIPLAGILGGEYVTIPFFANKRVDTTSVSMDQQTDRYNIQSFTANADGSEVDKIYGCWLDINQPFKPDGVTPNNVLPVFAPPKQDGPFSVSDPNPNFRPVPIGQSIARALHQCLITEVAFDPSPIPLGADSADWDKLAQRNVAWSDVGSAQAGTTFEIRPTSSSLPAAETPDELMIDWGDTPAIDASIYLPAVDAADVLTLANRMYTSHKLTSDGQHTIRCKPGGITYVPIPQGGPVNYAGLLTVDLDTAGRRGENFTVVVRQLTNAFGNEPPPPPPPPPPAPQPKIQARTQPRTDVVVQDQIAWRRVIGAFQISIPVKEKQSLLVREERNLAVLRWIAEAIPTSSRWYPVFSQYLEFIGGRVTGFGGNPGTIEPSPTGGLRFPLPPPGFFPGIGATGKVVNIVYDRFGDFEGFILRTELGELRRYRGHEERVEELVRSAWRERTVITVFVEPKDPEWAALIVLDRLH